MDLGGMLSSGGRIIPWQQPFQQNPYSDTPPAPLTTLSSASRGGQLTMADVYKLARASKHENLTDAQGRALINLKEQFAKLLQDGEGTEAQIEELQDNDLNLQQMIDDLTAGVLQWQRRMDGIAFWMTGAVFTREGQLEKLKDVPSTIAKLCDKVGKLNMQVHNIMGLLNSQGKTPSEMNEKQLELNEMNEVQKDNSKQIKDIFLLAARKRML
jgi:hypothetical protein